MQYGYVLNFISGFISGSVATTVIGWFITNHLTSERELKKEKRQLIADNVSKLNTALKELGKYTNDYYFPSKNDIDSYRVALDIKTVFVEIERYVDWISEHGKDFHASIYDLYDEITGGNFESSNLKPGKHYSDKCHCIAKNIQNLIADVSEWHEMVRK